MTPKRHPHVHRRSWNELSKKSRSELAAELGSGRCDESLGGFMSEDCWEVAAVGDSVSLGFFLNILRDLAGLGVMGCSVRNMAREFEDARKQEVALCVKRA